MSDLNEVILEDLIDAYRRGFAVGKAEADERIAELEQALRRIRALETNDE